MPPTKDDNLTERFARIEVLMEEYRIKHEDLVEYVRAARERGRTARESTRRGISDARLGFAKAKRVNEHGDQKNRQTK